VKLAIGISGTPGTGKTAVGQLVAQQTSATFLDLSQVVKDQKLFEGRDHTRDTFIADLEALQQHILHVVSQSKEKYVIVGHFVDELSDEIFQAIIILRCDPFVLIQRLRERQWPETKIVENLQAEILGECTAQSLSRHPPDKLFEINTSDHTTEETAKIIGSILAGHGVEYSAGEISWLHTMDPKILHLIMEENRLP
jgi:adenylate kinase